MKKVILSVLYLVAILFFAGCDFTKVFGSSENTVRTLDVSASSVDTFEVSSYESLHQYGPTQKFFHLKEQNSVIHIETSYDSSFETSVTVNIFENNSKTDVDKWINNQHSDGIYADAPKPIEVFTLSKNQFSLKPVFIENTSFGDNEAYDSYNIELTVDSVSEEYFSLMEFTAYYSVHVLTQKGE